LLKPNVMLGDDPDQLLRERRVGDDVDRADVGGARGRDHARALDTLPNV